MDKEETEAFYKERCTRRKKEFAAEDMYDALHLAYESMTGNNDPFKVEIWDAAINAVFAALAKADGKVTP